MSTKPVTTRATTATGAECVQRGLCRETPGARRGGRHAAAEDDPRPSILQLITEGLTVIPNLSPAGSVLRRKHGFATFVHKRLEWSLVDQSPK